MSFRVECLLALVKLPYADIASLYPGLVAFTLADALLVW